MFPTNPKPDKRWPLLCKPLPSKHISLSSRTAASDSRIFQPSGLPQRNPPPAVSLDGIPSLSSNSTMTSNHAQSTGHKNSVQEFLSSPSLDCGKSTLGYKEQIDNHHLGSEASHTLMYYTSTVFHGQDTSPSFSVFVFQTPPLFTNYCKKLPLPLSFAIQSPPASSLVNPPFSFYKHPYSPTLIQVRLQVLRC